MIELPASTFICIEVAYAEPERAVVKSYRLDSCATVESALRRAHTDPDFAGIDVMGASVGVFGVVASTEQRLFNGDRLEIYRPLAVDPKTARRARARQAAKAR